MRVVNKPTQTDHYRRFDLNGFAVRELLIVVPLVIGVFVVGIYFELSVGRDAFIKWGGLVAYTAVLFGFFINYSRQFFRQWKFWGLAALLLAIHLTAFAIPLTHVEEWRLTWFMIMAFEYPVLVFFRNRLPDPLLNGKA
jgi:hypothetical protein